MPYFAGDSHEGIIDFVAWSHDSNRVLLALRVGDFDGERQHGVYRWYLYFNTRDGKFESTDRLRAANKGAWKRWENFGDERAGKFRELTTAESIDQSKRSKGRKEYRPQTSVRCDNLGGHLILANVLLIRSLPLTHPSGFPSISLDSRRLDSLTACGVPPRRAGVGSHTAN